MQTRQWFVPLIALTVLATSVGPLAAQSTNAPKRSIDKEYTFSGARLRYLPTVGQVLDVSYTQTGGGGLLEATNVNSSRSN